MGLKHDVDLQRRLLPTGYFGHAMLLDPANMSLRGTILNGEARREAGLSDECEGRYAGSLWCTPSLAHFWQHCGGRVLETHFQYPGRASRGDGGQRSAHQGSTRTQDGHQRRRMDCRPAPTRPLTPQLYSSSMAAHGARTDPLTHQFE